MLTSKIIFLFLVTFDLSQVVLACTRAWSCQLLSEINIML